MRSHRFPLARLAVAKETGEVGTAGRKWFGYLAGLASVSLMAGMVAVGVVSTAGPAAAATASCTFDGLPATAFIPVSGGGATVTIACSGLPPSASVAAVEASPQAGVITPTSDETSQVDLTALKTGTTTASGTVNISFTLPDPFTATDHSAVCPPTQAQVNTGLVGCAIAVANIVTQTAYADALLKYSGQPAPQPPTLALGSASASAGQAVSVHDAASATSWWWGNATAATAIPSSGITVGTAHAGASTASVSAASYVSSGTTGTLHPPALGGGFVVPCGVTGPQTVRMTEANSTPAPGTISATASLTVVPGTTPAITSISPTRGPSGGGTTVTISGCNFSGATSVTFGGVPAKSFTVNSRHVH